MKFIKKLKKKKMKNQFSFDNYKKIATFLVNNGKIFLLTTIVVID